MTSIINLPANYSLSHYDFMGCWVLYIDGFADCKAPVYSTKEEAKQAAHDHYKQNNWTAEDQVEQDYFDRHPIGA